MNRPVPEIIPARVRVAPVWVTVFVVICKSPELPTLSVAPTVKLSEVVTVAEAAIVRLLKVSVPEFAIDDPLFIVMVPEDGVSTEDVPFVSAPPTVKLVSAVTVAEAAVVRLKKVRVPEFDMVDPSLNVIVPDVGVNTPEPPTENVPPMVAVPAPVEMEFALMVRLP